MNKSTVKNKSKSTTALTPIKPARFKSPITPVVKQYPSFPMIDDITCYPIMPSQKRSNLPCNPPPTLRPPAQTSPIKKHVDKEELADREWNWRLLQIHQGKSAQALESLWRNSIFLGKNQMPNTLESTTKVENWLNEKLKSFRKTKDVTKDFAEKSDVYTIAFNEVCHQVSLTSIELSRMLVRIWGETNQRMSSLYDTYTYTKHELDIGTTGRELQLQERIKELKNIIGEKDKAINELNSELEAVNKLFDQQPMPNEVTASGVTKHLANLYYDMMEHTNQKFKLEPLVDQDAEENDFVSMQARFLDELTESPTIDYTKPLPQLLLSSRIPSPSQESSRRLSTARLSLPASRAQSPEQKAELPSVIHKEMTVNEFVMNLNDRDRLQALRMLLENKFIKDDCIGDIKNCAGFLLDGMSFEDAKTVTFKLIDLCGEQLEIEVLDWLLARPPTELALDDTKIYDLSCYTKEILHGFNQRTLEDIIMYLYKETPPSFGESILKILLTDDKSQTHQKDLIGDLSSFNRRIYKGIGILDARELFTYLLELLRAHLDNHQFNELASPFLKANPQEKGPIVVDVAKCSDDIIGGMNANNVKSMLEKLLPNVSEDWLLDHLKLSKEKLMKKFGLDKIQNDNNNNNNNLNNNSNSVTPERTQSPSVSSKFKRIKKRKNSTKNSDSSDSESENDNSDNNEDNGSDNDEINRVKHKKKGKGGNGGGSGSNSRPVSRGSSRGSKRTDSRGSTRSNKIDEYNDGRKMNGSDEEDEDDEDEENYDNEDDDEMRKGKKKGKGNKVRFNETVSYLQTPKGAKKSKSPKSFGDSPNESRKPSPLNGYSTPPRTERLKGSPEIKSNAPNFNNRSSSPPYIEKHSVSTQTDQIASDPTTMSYVKEIGSISSIPEEYVPKKEDKRSSATTMSLFYSKPLPWSQYMKKKHKKGKKLSLLQLESVICDIYQSKAIADQTNDREGHERTALPMHVRDYFTQKYGLKKISDEYIYGLCHNVNDTVEHSIRVRVFATLLGIYRGDRYTPQLCDVMLGLLSLSIKRLNQIRIRMDIQGGGFMSCASLLNAVEEIFAFDNSVLSDLLAEQPDDTQSQPDSVQDEGVDDVIHKTYFITVSGQKKLVRFIHDIKIDAMSVGAKGMGDKVVNIDTFLNGFSDIYLDDMLSWREAYFKLFDLYDEDNSGLMELDEFKKVMAHCTGTSDLPEKKVNELFQQIHSMDKNISDEEGITKEGFVEVLLNNCIYPPDDAPPRRSSAQKSKRRLSLSPPVSR